MILHNDRKSFEEIIIQTANYYNTIWKPPLFLKLSANNIIKPGGFSIVPTTYFKGWKTTYQSQNGRGNNQPTLYFKEPKKTPFGVFFYSFFNLSIWNSSLNSCSPFGMNKYLFKASILLMALSFAILSNWSKDSFFSIPLTI